MTTPASPPPADPPDPDPDADPPGHARDWTPEETARFAARHHLPGGAGHRPQREADSWPPAAEAAFLRHHNLSR